MAETSPTKSPTQSPTETSNSNKFTGSLNENKTPQHQTESPFTQAEPHWFLIHTCLGTRYTYLKAAYTVISAYKQFFVRQTWLCKS